MKNTNALLSIKNLKKYFPLKKTSFFQKEQLYVRANDGITFDIKQGETFGLVGESGCGKSTLGRVVLQLYNQTSGTTMYYGRSLDEVSPHYVADTLKHPHRYFKKYKSALAHAENVDKQCEHEGDKASFLLLQKQKNAHDDLEKKLWDIAKILGGFTVTSDINEAASLLLRQHHNGAAICKQKDLQTAVNLDIDLLQTQLAEKKKAKANTSSIEKRIVKLEEKVAAIDEKLKPFYEKDRDLDDSIAKLRAKHKDDPKFIEFEAMLDSGIDLSRLKYSEIRLLRKDIQIIFQDPYSSLNPRMTVGQIIEEGLVTHKFFKRGSAKMQEYILQEMRDCGLSDYMLHRYPHQFSGGQRQRICIARALAVKPKFVVCDEAVSALDVSIQSQIINLLQDLKEKADLTYMFISHDLSVVKYISDRIGVMYLGDLVELSSKDDMFDDPRHPYTIALLSAIPTTDVDDNRERIMLEGNIPSPIKPPSGCKFHTRCFMATEKCSRVPPVPVEVSPGHFVSCHFPEKKIDNGKYLFKLPDGMEIETKN